MMKQHRSAERVSNSFLRGAEKRFLSLLVRILPVEVTPDHLTTIGISGAVMIFLGYVLCNYNTGFLWLASLGFLVNWFGDSLDGSIARYRKIERPIYGFFIDHNVDSMTIFLVGAGLGFSPYMRMDVALFLITAYFMLAISTYINAYLQCIFKLSYGKFGPTEARTLAVIGNSLLYFIKVNPHVNILGISLSYADIAGIAAGTVMILMFLITFFRDKKKLRDIDSYSKIQSGDKS